jgi:hypothetical protein
MLICVNTYLLLLMYMYNSMSSPIKDQGLGSDHMNKSVSQEQSVGEGYQTPSVPCPSIDRATRRKLQCDPSLAGD